MDKIIYSFLKELENNEDRLLKGEDEVIPVASDYDITDRVYGDLITRLEGDKLIDCNYGRIHGIPATVTSAKLTSKGREYIKENSKLGKLYRGIKEIKDFIK